ncbi:MAG TPA: phage Gp37/Gp68 family protein [Terriglobia bacterium]|nr:phage Gp37/Gp68 family protein [Terriglobia bacterium]
MGKTSIEWTSDTWNPVTGCTKVSQGCKNCYAERVFPRPYPGRKFTDVRMHEDRLDQPLRWKRPRKIFVNSMSDLFHESIPDRYIAQIFAVMGMATRHTFQVLTKRPSRMHSMMTAQYGSDYKAPIEWKSCFLRDVRYWAEKWDWFPPKTIEENNKRNAFIYCLKTGKEKFKNVHLGVSVENQETADERIPLLLQTPAAVRWVSYEPVLGPVNFAPFFSWRPAESKYERRSLDWIVSGGESGPKARPSELDWYRSVRDQCAAAGVPFFMKQLGAHPMTRIGADQAKIPFRIKDRKGGDMEEWPRDLRIREMP